MWPYLIREPIEIGTYGLMAALGFLTAQWLLARDLDRRGYDRRYADTIVMLAIVGGLVGAKLAYLFTEAETVSWRDFFSGSGLTWHGGLILASAMIIGWFRLRRLPIWEMLDAVAPFLASGYAFGRLGCFVSGDGCYGLPCEPGDLDEVFCMAFPNGIVPTTVPVHPTPLYEAAAGFLTFGVLWALRRRLWRGVPFAIWMSSAGFFRFWVEFIRRPDQRPDRILGLRDAQLVALVEVLVGLVLLAVALKLAVRVKPPERVPEPPAARPPVRKSKRESA